MLGRIGEASNPSVAQRTGVSGMCRGVKPQVFPLSDVDIFPPVALNCQSPL